MIQESSDEYAVSVTEHIHSDLLSLHDAILIVSTKPKLLSSTLGHSSMNKHPFLTSRISQANQNLSELLLDLKCNDFEKLADVAENEALTLHALLMTANPATILMQPGTIEIIRLVREARNNGMAGKALLSPLR